MESDIRQFAQTAVFAALGSVAIGFLFFSSSVFHLSSPAFQLVATGIFGGIVLATSSVTSIQKSVAVVILATFAYETLLKPFGAALIVRDVSFLLGMGATIILYRVYFHPRLESIHLARPLVLGALLALNGILMTKILQFVIPLFFEYSQLPPTAEATNLALEFLIGIGLGVGNEMCTMPPNWWARLLPARA